MRVLVITEMYPDKVYTAALNYIRVRNVVYKKNGIDVTVISFNAHECYEMDGIPVLTLQEYEDKYMDNNYDILICHAANIKHHLIFLIKHGKRFPHFVFFFHGHEVLKINKVYAKPYPWQKRNILGTFKQNLYDDFKLFVWNKYYLSIKEKSHFVFVSNWMLDEFEKWTRISRTQIHYSIIYNSVGKKYEVETYDDDSPKPYDFISIRAVLDGSKYCVDVINAYAWKYPQYNFLLVGVGEIFNHIPKAPNIHLIEKYLGQDEIIGLLNQSKIALMPTRTDAQGVMMCEMATFGIPVITSNIPVCHEVFDKFENVAFIDNDIEAAEDLSKIYERLTSAKSLRNFTYSEKATVGNEVDLLNKIMKEIIATNIG